MINRKQTTFVNKKKKKDSFPFIPLVLNFIFLGDNKLPFNLRYTYL